MSTPRRPSGGPESPRPGKPRGVFVGMSTLDVIHYVDRVPDANEKLFATEQLVVAGGPATNAAIAFATLGGEAVLVSALGRHALGCVVRDELAAHGVRHVDLAPDDQLPPIVSAINVSLATGHRSVVSSLAPAPPRLPDDLSVVDAAVVLLDGHQPEAALAVAAAARAAGIPVVLDGGSWKRGTAELLRYVDYVICSEAFLPPGCTDALGALASLAERGVPYRAVTRGARPILWEVDSGSGEIEVPRAGPVIDTLGAGDVFHGAFCRLVGTADLGFADALAASAEVAALSCTTRGARVVSV